MSETPADVIIVGGGPVGLYLGCLLLQNGVSCRILEKRTESSRHTRSIGIHPPGLECLAEVGVAEQLLGSGIPVSEGLAFANTEYLGRLTFESCPGPYRFVLALPQYVTESVLARRLHELDPEALVRGAEVTGFQEIGSGVSVMARQHGDPVEIRSVFVVGSDGPDSTVRSAAHISFPGAPYDDTFIMGDFRDTTGLGPRAAIYLTDRGVVESFPLPGGVRRWVAKTDTLLREAQPDTFCRMIHDRTGHTVQPESNSMLSAFRVYHYLADRMTAGSMLLAGDAAHIVSPIGGQGMNLGWLDAREAAGILVQAIRAHGRLQNSFQRYSASRRRAARAAQRRSEFNMWMGRATRLQSMKYRGVAVVLRTPIRHLFAKRFTMRGL